MLKTASISDFQSIHKAHIDLGKFTVIVGPSSSGKSAFLRSLRVLANNATSPFFVSRGAKVSEIAVTTDDSQDVSIRRGKALSEYTVNGEIYAKAGTAVPEAVQKVLRLPKIEGSELCFAFQFDRPFLLDDPATKTAKVLGDLTNITVIFEAVRAANRRKLDTNSTLKVRQKDLEDLMSRAQEYAGLRERQKEVVQARESFESIRVRVERVKALRDLMAKIAVVESVVAEYEAKPIPDMGKELDAAHAKAQKVSVLRRRIETIRKAQKTIKDATEAYKALDGQITEMTHEESRVLVEAGYCPVCGSEVG